MGRNGICISRVKASWLSRIGWRPPNRSVIWIRNSSGPQEKGRRRNFDGRLFLKTQNFDWRSPVRARSGLALEKYRSCAHWEIVPPKSGGIVGVARSCIFGQGKSRLLQPGS